MSPARASAFLVAIFLTATGCASTSKDLKDLRRKFADRDAALRVSLDRQHELETDLERVARELERQRLEKRDLESRLVRLLTVEADLKATEERLRLNTASLTVCQKKMFVPDNATKLEIQARLEACRQSIVDKERAAYNEALVASVTSLEVFVEPWESGDGFFGGEKYSYVELRYGGRRIWSDRFPTGSREGAISRAVSLAPDILPFVLSRGKKP
jgi:hypothetical protein